MEGYFDYSSLNTSTVNTLANNLYTVSTAENQTGNTFTTASSSTTVNRAYFIFKAIVVVGGTATTLRVESASSASAPNITGFNDYILSAREIS
jgi:NAD kinase